MFKCLGFEHEFIESNLPLSDTDPRVVLEKTGFFSSIKLGLMLIEAQQPVNKIFKLNGQWDDYQGGLPRYDQTSILDPKRPLYLLTQPGLVTNLKLDPELRYTLDGVHSVFSNKSSIIEEFRGVGANKLINLCVKEYSPASLGIINSLRTSEAYNNYAFSLQDIANGV